MKIGFFGNANSYPFMIARAMRRMGHEVLFIVDRGRTETLNRPENRYDDISIPYPDWIYDASPLDLWAYPKPSAERQKVIHLLRDCDAVILNQFGLSLSEEIRRPSIALLTGSDLEEIATYDYVETMLKLFQNSLKNNFLFFFKRSKCSKYYRKLVSDQRNGIRNAAAVSYFAKGLLPRADRLLEEIGVQDAQRVFILMTDLERLNYQPLPRNQVPRVFCVARLTWVKSPETNEIIELDYKGTDIMIRGISLFCITTGLPLDIRLVKKGKHIAETVKLIDAEGLSHQVTWLDEMNQNEVFNEYRNADIVFDQLGFGMVSMGTLDALAMGRPVIANGRPEILEPIIGEVSPICQASSVHEVCRQLERLVPDVSERERVGLASRKYVEKYFSSERAATICLDKLHGIPRTGSRYCG